jgi:hypothetical protein
MGDLKAPDIAPPIRGLLQCDLLLLLLVFSLLACSSPAPLVQRYIVATNPIDLGIRRHPGLCLAVDSKDLHHVWWWEPGRSGCSSRSTGPALLRADTTEGLLLASGDIRIHFPLQTIIGGPLDVGLLIQESGMRVLASGAWVLSERRGNLDVPFSTP